MPGPKRRPKSANKSGEEKAEPFKRGAAKAVKPAKAHRAATDRKSTSGPPISEIQGMVDATLEQRLEWLQNGLREIGLMCLKLSGDHGTAASEGGGQAVTSSTGPTGDVSQEVATGPAGDFAAVVPLSQFLDSVQDLTPEERLQVVGAAIAMLGEVYVHLPLKRAMHGIDPLQRLRLLKLRMQAQIEHHEAEASARVFHDQMIEIFHSLRDLHTNYILPASYQGKTAFLPFLLEEFYEGNPPQRNYLVTRIQPGFVHPTFTKGVAVTHWNGIPIDRAVEINAEREAGSNEDARHARGLEALTLRPMALTAPPDESWVIIGYVSGEQKLEVRLEWQVVTPAPSPSGAVIDNPLGVAGGDVARLMGFDARTEAVRRARKYLFFPEQIGMEHRMAQALASTGASTSPGTPTTGVAPTAISEVLGYDVKGEALRHVKTAMRFSDIASAQRNLRMAQTAAEAATPAEGPQSTSLFPEFFSFRTVTTPSGVFGYVRIFSFMTMDANSFVAEFARIAQLLPQNGLILDVRGNGGGNINAGEQLLQVLTAGPIDPEPFHFINTPTTLSLCRSEPSLHPWVESIDLAVQTGEIYSQGFLLTSVPQANAGLSYRYPGKVVLVVDALCYSTTDIFTAGFQDHRIGKILGTSSRTGAGGANVWTYNFFGGLPGFPPLPKEVSFRAAIRRSTRVRSKAGVPLEDLGVQTDDVHRMTRRDILEGNVDLISKAAEMLS